MSVNKGQIDYRVSLASSIRRRLYSHLILRDGLPQFNAEIPIIVLIYSLERLTNGGSSVCWELDPQSRQNMEEGRNHEQDQETSC